MPSAAGLSAGGKGTLAVGFGGDAATGGNGGFVELQSGVTVPSGIETRGNNANGLLAQSVGGGGGSGGFAIVGGISGSLATVESFGGNAVSGGDGGTVYLANTSLILTRGTSANAVAAQSIGGGGDGGFSIANPVLNHTDYIIGSGADTRVLWGGFLEVICALAGIGAMPDSYTDRRTTS